MEPAELILTDAETRERDVFVERMLASTAGTFNIFTIYIGKSCGRKNIMGNVRAVPLRSGSNRRAICLYSMQTSLIRN